MNQIEKESCIDPFTT